MRRFLTRSESRTFGEIETFDLDELITFADETGVSVTGCDTVHEIQQRVIQEINIVRGKHKTVDIWNAQRQSQLKKEYDHKRNELSKIYKSTEISLAPSVGHLNKILTHEGTDCDLSKDIQAHLQGLHSGECNVLIAGETNAGKSTLLNLLLEVEVLPKSILSCTSGICKLKYSPVYKVVLIQHNGEQTERVFPDHKETREFLKETIATQEQLLRETRPEMKEVHVMLPANILKSGITIIDSPGFGENEAMDAVSEDFVTNNDVNAFVYIIKTDHSGGVQEDMLIQFLKRTLSITQHKSQWSHYFNPEAALFICNRWDQISERDKPKVRDHVLSKLRSVWPGLQDGQVCFFSSKVGEAHEGWSDLHGALDDLFRLAREGVITTSYCWLRHIVRECAFCLRTIVYRTNKDDVMNKEKLTSTTKLLSSLSSETKKSILKLKADLKQEEAGFKEEIRKFLSSKEMFKELSIWEVEDIPDLYTLKGSSTSRMRDEIIVERMIEILDVCQITSDLFTKFVEGKLHSEMSRLGRQMDVVTTDLKDSTISMSRSIGNHLSHVEDSGIALLNEQIFSRLVTSVSGVVKNFDERNPSGVMTFVDRSRKLVKRVTETISKPKPSRRTSLPNLTDPFVLMSAHAKERAIAISNDDALLSLLVSRYMYIIEAEIDRLTQYVPTFVTQIQRLLSQINQVSFENETIRNDLEKTMEYLEQQKELVRGFGYVHIKDIQIDDLMMNLDDPRVKSSSLVKVDIDDDKPDFLSLAIWTRFQHGTLSIDDGEDDITVRYYIHQPGDTHLYKEVAKLRCLDHFSVARFIGTTRAESQSAFIFLDQLTTSRMYLRRSRDGHPAMPRLKQSVPKLLEGLVEGLDYIHRHGLVHMELTVDTVMMSLLGEVRLVGMCLPRLAKFPVERDSIEAGDFTCLSPEVLRGQVYTKEDDVYSLGLFISEIMLQDRPFKTERTWTLARFITHVDPSTMLTIPDRSDCKPLHELLLGCLVPGPYERLSSEQIRGLIQEMKNSDVLENLNGAKGVSRMGMRRPSALWSEDSDQGPATLLSREMTRHLS